VDLTLTSGGGTSFDSGAISVACQAGTYEIGLTTTAIAGGGTAPVGAHVTVQFYMS
jgi:hypothetical protein